MNNELQSTKKFPHRCFYFNFPLLPPIRFSNLDNENRIEHPIDTGLNVRSYKPCSCDGERKTKGELLSFIRLNWYTYFCTLCHINEAKQSLELSFPILCSRLIIHNWSEHTNPLPLLLLSHCP